LEYSIQAIRYGSAADDVFSLVMGTPNGEKSNLALVIWLIRGSGHNILLDSGHLFDLEGCLLAPPLYCQLVSTIPEPSIALPPGDFPLRHQCKCLR